MVINPCIIGSTATTTAVQYNTGLEVLSDFSIPYLVRALTPKSTLTHSYDLTPLISPTLQHYYYLGIVNPSDC